MFWRIVWRLLYASKARLAVAFLAISSGATVCAALLNLQMDAEQKLTREFRALGTNVVVSAPRGAEASEARLLDAGIVDRIKAIHNRYSTTVVPFLYITARTHKLAATNPMAMNAASEQDAPREPGTLVILSGTHLNDLEKIAPAWKMVRADSGDLQTQSPCLLGIKAAEQLAAKLGDALQLDFADRKQLCSVTTIVSSGGAEDNQMFLELPVVQRLAGLAERISLVQISVPGTPEEIQDYTGRLAQAIPLAEVRPVRALAEAEGRLFQKIQGLILATVILILVLTTLCVLATMAALAVERRHDVGLMKALGGSIRRIMRLFLFEAGVLGFTGGVLGCFLGIALSEWIGQRVFGVELSPRFAVVPITLGLMIAVSIAGAFPLRLLSHVSPVEIFRGEA
ncbi:MAG TPA: FtsX-like permease family protein [Candidatus Dormibacteraeota bacterium]|nr:FtsX-like permease family protein [Candidatus Dormibacteraeota bacterium]